MLELHITYGIIVGLLLILSVFLFMGKGTIFINGMMFMPKEARDKINKKALGRFAGSLMVIVNITLVLTWIDTAWLETKNFWLTWVATGIMLIAVIIYMVIGVLKREKWFRIK